MRRPTLLAIALWTAFVAPVRATVLYETSVGYNFSGGGNAGYFGPGGLTGGKIGGYSFSRNGALCGSDTTVPDYLCASFYSEADVVGGARLILKSAASLTRKQAVGLGYGAAEYLVYGDTTITISNIGSSPAVAGPVIAYFVFGLHGTASTTKTDSQVLSQATGVATLSSDGVYAIQCAGDPCGPIVVRQPNVNLATSNDITANVFRLNLRADARAGAPIGFNYDAEMIANFADTLELLAIRIHDIDDNPLPDVHAITSPTGGTPSQPGIMFDNTIPPTTTSPETTSTTTTLPGGGGTTTTLPGGGCPAGANYVGVRCRVDALTALVQASDVGKLGKPLGKLLGKASAALAKAESLGDVPAKKLAKSIRKAAKALTAYGKKLDSKGAVKKLDAGLRATLKAPVAGLVADVNGLATP